MYMYLYVVELPTQWGAGRNGTHRSGSKASKMAEELSSIHATRCKTKEKRPGGARHLRYVNKGGKGQHKETQRKTREEEERKKEKQERKKREEQERKKLEEEKR